VIYYRWRKFTDQTNEKNNVTDTKRSYRIRKTPVFTTGEIKEPATLSEVTKNTNNPAGYKFSCAGHNAPFLRPWNSLEGCYGNLYDIPYGLKLSNLRLDDDEVKDKECIVRKTWNDDNRDQVIDAIKAIASRYIAIGDEMWFPSAEPVYHVMTSGLGKNHGRTGLFVEYTYNYQLSDADWFGAHELKQAVSHTQRVAMNREDDESVPMEVNTRIEVLIPRSTYR